VVKELDRPNTNKNIHPPVIALLFIVTAYFLGRFIPLPFAAPMWIRYIGLALAFLGFLLGIGAFIEFRRAHTTVDPHGSVKQLVTSGIFRFSRNPIYVGFLLMVIGLPLNFGLYWGFVLAPFFVLAMNGLVITHEEAYLERKFGKEYTTYMSHVRRWL
jgi:protein-S-isoprenylcysteine O-methyltransferase Ste14